MLKRFLTRILVAAGLIGWVGVGLLWGQSAAQWSYSFIAGQGTASYPGNVVIVGSLTAGSTSTPIACAALPALTGPVTSTVNTCNTAVTNNAITNAMLAQAATRTIKGNATAGTANVTDIAAGQFPATQTNDNAAAGTVGEVQTSTILAGSAVSLTTGTPANITSVSLTAGDWECDGNAGYAAQSTTVTTVLVAWMNTVSATAPTPPAGGYAQTFTNTTGTNLPFLNLNRYRYSLASTTTVYLGTQSNFTTNTLGGYGYLLCRRMR